MFREIRDMGMLRAVFFMVILLPILVLFLYRQLPLQDYNYGIPGVFLLLVYMIHRGRKDYFFLSKLLNPPAWIYFAEYFVFSIPFLVLLVVCRQYIPALAYVALLFPVCLVVPSPKGAKAYNAWIQYIPAGMFEWQSGFRASLPVVIPFYALGLGGIYNIWFVAASVILLSLTIGSFYGVNESHKILAAAELDAGSFLKSKLVRHIKYWALFLSPLLLIAFLHYRHINRR